MRKFGLLVLLIGTSAGVASVLSSCVLFVGGLCGGEGDLPCLFGQYCKFVAGTCGDENALGVCTQIPDVCAEIFAPVCGCDGLTYGNECEAAVAGVSVRREGECTLGEPCGDTGEECSSGEYCEFDVGDCGEGDAAGTCALIPEVCTQEFAPVCGCDGQTYGNDCQAAAAGVNVRAAGECEDSGG